jgi:hypothetical protein
MMLRTRLAVGATALLLGASVTAPRAQTLEDQLGAYTGANAEGYLNPLASAVGANLNSAIFNSAHIPESGFHFAFKLSVMGVMFGDDDRTFTATTEQGFIPETTTDKAPTVVGPGTGVTVPGSGGSTFTFPGGFDLSSFAIAVPQVDIGAIAGTEATFRFLAFDVGDFELGKVFLFGIGARHSLSRYFSALPLDLAGAVYWQTFEIGDDLIKSNAISFGLQASKNLGMLAPYGGLSFDSFKMDVKYEDSAGSRIEYNFDSKNTMHLTLGLSANLLFTHAFAEYGVADQNNFAFGLAFGN